MCNEYQLILPVDEVIETFDRTGDRLIFPGGMPNFGPMASIRIGDRAPIITRGPDGPQLIVSPWAWKSPQGRPVFNVRSDGRSFDGVTRCLIPADGFFEFTDAEPGQKRKTKWRFIMFGRTRAFQTPLVQGADDVLRKLETTKLRLKVDGELKPSARPYGQPETFKVAQPPPGQRGPGVGAPDPVIDTHVRVRGRQKAAVQGGEPVGLGLTPDPPFGILAAEVSEPLLGDFLGAGAKAVADVVARDHEVPAIASSPPNQHMGVRLVGVEMADGDPVQTRLTEVVGDPRHDLPGEALEVQNPIAVLG